MEQRKIAQEEGLGIAVAVHGSMRVVDLAEELSSRGMVQSRKVAAAIGSLVGRAAEVEEAHRHRRKKKQEAGANEAAAAVGDGGATLE